MAKFRGGSDDWLDDQRSARRGGKKPPSKGAARAQNLPAEEANATVAEVFPKQCRVRLDQPEADGRFSDVLCAYRRANVVGRGPSKDGEDRERSPVAVGDRVQVTRLSPDSGVIEGICARSNSLVRPAPGREKMVHVLAANVDELVIVASVHEPDFSPGLVDRYLVAADAAGIPTSICLSKIDLAQSGEEPATLYKQLGHRVHEVCAKSARGVDDLRASLLGKTVVFSGQSGVGKTSLLRSLLGAEVGKIGEVSQVTGKGRHTTTSAVLLGGPAGSLWIDTPGVRAFGLLIAPEELRRFYPEFAAAKCRQADCMHLDEEGCSVREMPRYASYRRILESLLAGEQ